MKGTFKIRDYDGKCCCALYTEDYVFYNALQDEKSQEFFKTLVNPYVTVSDLDDVDFFASQGDLVSNRFVEEFYLISLKVALSCKDFKEFLFKCKELPNDNKEEN